MYVIIVGGGRIGRYIAKDMTEKGHDVTVIERKAERCEQLVAETNVLVIEGDAGDVRYLEQAHVDRADVFVATTHEDDDNLVACQLAKIEFGVKRAISRVNTPKNVEIFETLGIEAVSSTRLISELLENEFTVGDLVRLTSLRGGRVSLVQVRVPNDGRPRRAIQDLDLPFNAVIVVIFRGEETIIPRGTAEIGPNDEIVALITPEVEDELREALVGAG